MIKIARSDPPGAQAISLLVVFVDETAEDFHFATEAEANAFVHSVSTYHRLGIGEEWYGDIILIQPRPFLASVN